jgi:hypothetical protein
MLIYPKLHFWPFILAHLGLISSTCLLWTCAHTHIKIVSSRWCIEHLITKIGINGPMAHFLFTTQLWGGTTMNQYYLPNLFVYSGWGAPHVFT